MIVTTELLRQAAYCPFLPRLGVLNESKKLSKDLVDTFLYLYSKKFEQNDKDKLGWRNTLNRFAKLHWADRNKNDKAATKEASVGYLILDKLYKEHFLPDQRKIIAISYPYSYAVLEQKFHIDGNIDLVFCNDVGDLDIVFVGEVNSPFRDFSCISGYLSVISTGLKVRSVESLIFDLTGSGNLIHKKIYPDNKYRDYCATALTSTLRSIQGNFLYPNQDGCSKCIGRSKCKL